MPLFRKLGVEDSEAARFGEGCVCITHTGDGTRLPRALLSDWYVCIAQNKIAPR